MTRAHDLIPERPKTPSSLCREGSRRTNWLVVILVGALRLYQRVISPLILPRCRFRPTCSEYMIEAITKKGVVIGLLKGCWRIMRCHPFSPGGYDPVE